MKARTMKQMILIALFVTGLGIAIACLSQPLRVLVDVVRGASRAKKAFQETDKKIASLSNERLEKLLQDCEKLASQATNDQVYTQYEKNIPSDFDDLDPSWVGITTNIVKIELMGGLVHNGIVARKADSGTWSLYHYDDRPQETRIK